MKTLPLETAGYRYVLSSFTEWLDVLGYSEKTIYILPNSARELLHWLETQDIKELSKLDAPLIKSYYDQLKKRANQRRGGGLANRTLNKHLQALKLFITYLNVVGRQELPQPRLYTEEANSNDITWLTKQEVKALYKATEENLAYQGQYNEAFNEALAARDRAMLAIFYGCGLRRREGTELDTSDINFDTKLLKVRKGKNYKERFVPVNQKNLEHLKNYVYDFRHQFVKDKREGALFLSRFGKRAQGQTLLLRLKTLQFSSDDIELQSKEIGLHTLRHSIATHLLENEMPLEMISRFLGHSSLESTQIYTHLANKPSPQEYPNIPGQTFQNLHEDERGL